MFKLLNKKKNNKGFTLVELVIVVAILAILVGILAPQYTKYVENSRKTADVNNMDELVKAVQVYAIDGATKTKYAAKEEITIAITNTGVTYDNKALAKSAFDAYVPNWEEIRLKGTRWESAPSIKLEIDTDGGVKIVEYNPAELKNYMVTGSGDVTPAPTTKAGN